MRCGGKKGGCCVVWVCGAGVSPERIRAAKKKRYFALGDGVTGGVTKRQGKRRKARNGREEKQR